MTHPPSRLARKLGMPDAVVLGLGSMIGAGIFAALAPAAQAAGSALLLGLGVAALVAYCNATSSAELAVLYPHSGGTYVYGRERLGPFFGFVAGWAFVIGKAASCAAMALTFAHYAASSFATPLAVSAVVVLTTVNYFGIAKTALATRVIVASVLACLAAVVLAALFGGRIDSARTVGEAHGGAYGVLQAAGFLFFAFAGYARIATLGEEVVDPARTIPRAIPLALGIALIVYAIVATSALLAAGAPALAAAEAPLVTAVEGGRFAALAPVARIGAAVASLGVLLSLLAGISRTMFAMAGNGDLPRFLASVHPRHRVPDRAEIVIAIAVVLVILMTDTREAIAFSSFAVLVYYAIANASALTLAPPLRRWARGWAVLGLAGCLLLAAMLPLASLAAGSGVLAAGTAVYIVKRAMALRRRSVRID